MKRTSRFLAILLTLAMLFSVTAFAAWDVYGGNANHNAVVNSAPTSSDPSITKVSLLNDGSGWDGVDNVPVMKTVGNDTYAFVQYDGHAAGATLARLKVNSSAADKDIVNVQINSASGFQLSTPVLVESNDINGLAGDALFVASAAGAECLAPLTDSKWTVDGGNVLDATAISIESDSETVTLSQTGVELNTENGYRFSFGIYVGTSSSVSGDITVKAYINGAVVPVINNSTSTTTAVNEVTLSGEPTDDGNGNYYYYYNVNLNDVSMNTSSSTVKFIVDINEGNESGTFEIRKPSMLADSGSIQKFVALYEANGPVADGNFRPTLNGANLSISQQINTPIVSDGTYIYFGTWAGGSRAGSYYQIKISDGTTKVFTPESYGFYWAGAVVYDGYVYFGSDNGTLYYQPVDNFGSVTTGITLSFEEITSAGNIRSTVMQSDGKLYLTSQGGYLWCCTLNNGVPSVSWAAGLGATSTSTPTKVGDRIYVGCYSGFNAGGVKCVSDSNHEVSTVASDFPVQCSIVVNGTGTGTDYVYFNTNAQTGCGYCYSYAGGVSGEQVWETDDDTYALGGMACENGYIVFGNDFNHLYVVK